jgi:transcriptional regulator with XRE-family HTH domain
LVAARKAAGLTQRDIADRIGRPPSFVGKIEGVERNLSVLELLAWCRALGVSPGQILDAVDEGEIQI